MSKKVEQFIENLKNNNLEIGIFIAANAEWNLMSIAQRKEVINYFVNSGELEIVDD